MQHWWLNLVTHANIKELRNLNELFQLNCLSDDSQTYLTPHTDYTACIFLVTSYLVIQIENTENDGLGDYWKTIHYSVLCVLEFVKMFYVATITLLSIALLFHSSVETFLLCCLAVEVLDMEQNSCQCNDVVMARAPVEPSWHSVLFRRDRKSVV